MSNMISANYAAGNYNYFVAKNYQTTDTTFKDKVEEKNKAGESVSETTDVNIVSEDEMSMEEYKAKIWKYIDEIPVHPSQKNTQYMITITDAAFERMKSDPEYEKKVLNSIYVNKTYDCGNAAPKTTVLYTDDTWEKSWGMTYGIADERNEVKADDEKSLWDIIMENHERAEEYYMEALKKHGVQMEQNQEHIKHNEVSKTWNSHRLLSEASNAYEANVICEPVGSNHFMA